MIKSGAAPFGEDMNSVPGWEYKKTCPAGELHAWIFDKWTPEGAQYKCEMCGTTSVKK